MDQKPNIIFLDVDGVLNAPSILERSPGGYIGIYPPKVSLLAKIVRETDAKIILTSSWQICWKNGVDNPPNPDGQYLVDALAVEGLEISAFVPSLFNRGRAIRNYLEEHDHGHWVVLDDETFDFARAGILDHVCRTDYRSGLDEDDVEKAIKILTTDMPDFKEGEDNHHRILGKHFGREL